MSDILSNIPEDQNNQVFLNNHTTPYFGRLLFHGRKAVKDGAIHSCLINSNGFYIKKTNESKPKEVKYVDELFNMMQNKGIKPGVNGSDSTGNSTNKASGINGNGSSSSSGIVSNNGNNRNGKRSKPDEKNSPNNEIAAQKSKLRNRTNPSRQ